MNKVVFVDNLSSCFFIDLDAGVPIIPFNGDVNDNELVGLANFLKKLCYFSNFREVASKCFGLECLKDVNNFGLAIKAYIEYHDKKSKY